MRTFNLEILFCDSLNHSCSIISGATALSVKKCNFIFKKMTRTISIQSGTKTCYTVHRMFQKYFPGNPGSHFRVNLKFWRIEKPLISSQELNNHFFLSLFDAPLLHYSSLVSMQTKKKYFSVSVVNILYVLVFFFFNFAPCLNNYLTNKRRGKKVSTFILNSFALFFFSNFFFYF